MAGPDLEFACPYVDLAASVDLAGASMEELKESEIPDSEKLLSHLESLKLSDGSSSDSEYEKSKIAKMVRKGVRKELEKMGPLIFRQIIEEHNSMQISNSARLLSGNTTDYSASNHTCNLMQASSLSINEASQIPGS